jgi:hypothetical protein
MRAEIHHCKSFDLQAQVNALLPYILQIPAQHEIEKVPLMSGLQLQQLAAFKHSNRAAAAASRCLPPHQTRPPT